MNRRQLLSRSASALLTALGLPLLTQPGGPGPAPQPTAWGEHAAPCAAGWAIA